MGFGKLGGLPVSQMSAGPSGGNFKTDSCMTDELPYIAPLASALPGSIPNCMSINLYQPSNYNWRIATGVPDDQNNISSFGFSGPFLTTRFTPLGGGALDDWLFTNKLNLLAGDSVEVSFRYGNNSSLYTEKLAVAFGNDRKASAMGSPIFEDLNIHSATTKDTSVVFTIPTSGVGYFGFHGLSDEDQYYLLLGDIEIKSLCPEVHAGSISGASSVCVGDTAHYSSNGDPDGLWFSEDLAKATIDQNGVLTANTSGLVRIGYVAYLAGSTCPQRDTAYFSIIVRPLPSVGLGGDQAICEGDTLTLTASSGLIQLGTTYEWSTSATTRSIIVSSADTYSVIVTNNWGCKAYDTMVLKVDSLPVVDLGPDVSFCSGDSLLLDAGNQDPSVSYAWSTNETTQQIIANTTGDFSVWVTDGNGCIGKDTVSITVWSLPVVDLGGDTSICNGLLLSMDAGNSGANFVWSTQDTSQAIVVDQADIYWVLVTDSNNCSQSDTIQLTLYDVPTSPLGNNGARCGAGVPAASVTSTAGMIGNGVFNWYDAPTGGNLLQSSTSQTYTSSISSTMTFYVSEGNMNGCESPRTQVIATINTQPAAFHLDSFQNSSLCSGLEIGNGWIRLDSVAFPGNYSLSYIYNNSLPVSNLITVPSSGVYLMDSLKGGNYSQITLTPTDGRCASLPIASVTIDEPLSPVISSAGIMDNSNCVQPDGAFSLAGVEPSVLYAIFYNGQNQDTLVANSTGELLLDSLATGDYENVYVVNTQTGCISDTLTNVIVGGAKPTNITGVQKQDPTCQVADGAFTILGNFENGKSYEVDYRRNNLPVTRMLQGNNGYVELTGLGAGTYSDFKARSMDCTLGNIWTSAILLGDTALSSFNSLAGNGIIVSDHLGSGTEVLFASPTCELVAKIKSGSSLDDSLGTVAAEVYVLPGVGYFDQSPFIQRYYELSATHNVGATVTLYFLDSEIQAYNLAAVDTGMPQVDEPVNGMSNLLIMTYHNAGANGPLGLFDTANSKVVIPSQVLHIGNIWAVTFVADSFSSFFAYTDLLSAPLAVKLKEFKAKNEGHVNRLSWTTASEEAGDYFELERSEDGKEFQRIATLKAKEASMGASYQYVDQQPYV